MTVYFQLLLVFVEGLAQLFFCRFKSSFCRNGKIFPCAVDVEIQHRHCGLIWRALPALTPGSRSLQRHSDLFGAVFLEYTRFKVERITVPGNTSRPFLGGFHSDRSLTTKTLSTIMPHYSSAKSGNVLLISLFE